MVTDEILGSQALTLAGFAKVADQLIARAYARRQRATTRPDRAGATGDALSREDAKQALERAVQRHGRAHASRAATSLTAPRRAPRSSRGEGAEQPPSAFHLT
jgi:hypothetical protein